MPEDFGLIAMIQIVITLGQTLMDSGMTSSLIRTENPDYKDYSTVFYTNLGASIFIYIIVFATAPFVASFFEEVLLTDLVRFYAISFIIQAFSSVQMARLTKQMEFKLQMLLQLPATLMGGICGVAMAYTGYGVWSLVGLNLTMTTVLAILLWLKSEWRPNLIFDWSRLKIHFNFGYKLTLSSLITNLYSESYTLFIGKFFSSTHLGLYKQAHSLRMFPVSNVTSALMKVTYPVFSEVQDDNVRLKNIYKKITFLVFFTTTPIMLISIIIAEPLFRFLLTDKWLSAVPIFQILCVSAIFYPISMYSLNIISAKGLSGLHLKLEIVKKGVSLLVLLASVRFGIYGVTTAASFSMIFGAYINCKYAGKLINYSIDEQLTYLLPIILLGVSCMIITYLVYTNILNEFTSIDLMILILSTLVFLSIYLGLSIVFKIFTVGDLRSLKNRLH